MPERIDKLQPGCTLQLRDFDTSAAASTHNASPTGIDSPKCNWIDWATLDCLRADGATAQINLNTSRPCKRVVKSALPLFPAPITPLPSR